MSIKLIYFRDQNQGISFFEGCSSDINTIAKEILFNPPNEASITAAFHEIFIKQKNIICIFDFETKTCRLAAIYQDQNDCDDDFRFVKRKSNAQIEDNEAKNLYKNNFVLSLVGFLIDQPLSFGPGLKNVIIEILGLVLPVLKFQITEPAKSMHIPMIETPTIANNKAPATPEIHEQATISSPTNSVDLPLLVSENDSTFLDSPNREEPKNQNKGILKISGCRTTSGSRRSRKSVRFSFTPQQEESLLISSYGPSWFTDKNNNVDDKICNSDSQEAKTPTIDHRPAISRNTNNNDDSISNNQGQRKRMISDLEYDENNIVVSPTDLESFVPENTPQIKKPRYSSKSSNRVKSPDFNIGYELQCFGRRIKYLYITAPPASSGDDEEEEIDAKWYQYEINEKLGTFCCTKCTNKKVSAKLNEENDEVILGRNKHTCQPKGYSHLIPQSITTDS